LPHSQQPAFVFLGPGDDLHWIGQRCAAVDIHPEDGETQAIVLT
jgi:hypothetical protein